MRPTFKKCPSCGSSRIKVVEGDYATKARGKHIVVPDVRRHECPVCGEILLDYDALKQIEAHRLPRKPKQVRVG